MLSCAQLPLARRPTCDSSQTVPSSDPIQPRRQSVVPAGLRLAAPERPPKAPARVKRPAVEPGAPSGARDGDGAPIWARSAAGAASASAAAIGTARKRVNMMPSSNVKGLINYFINELHGPTTWHASFRSAYVIHE